MITISLGDTIRYVPEDQDGDNPTVFLLTPLTLQEETELLDKVRGGEASADHRDINQVFRDKVKGWENLKDENGADVPHPGNPLPDNFVVGVSLAIRGGVFSALLAQAGMKADDDVGKSESQPS